MAALTGTLAGTQQGMISFTRQNEEEADRIGIQVLQRSGFDPQAMPMFMGKLLDESRYSTRPPEMLLTHPLPESRLADARNRANQMRPVVVQSSADFYLAKARTLGMYTNGDNKLGTDLLNARDKGNIRQQHAAQYGRALLAMESNNFDQGTQNAAAAAQRRPAKCPGISIWPLISTSDRRKPATPSIVLKTPASCVLIRCCS